MSHFASSWSSRSLVQSSTVSNGRLRQTIRYLVPGLLALLAAVALVFFIERVNDSWPNQPEKATQIVGIVFASLLVLPPAVYLGIRRRTATVGTLALVMLASLSALLASCYLYVVSFEIFFPADILIWSETDFINDIVKFHQGYPIFSAQVNNESYTYLPGAQLLTYLLAWLLGHPASIAAYRMIQVGYSLASAIIAVGCWKLLVGANEHSRPFNNELLWGAILLPVFFLIANNSLTNPYTHLLHNDALAQLVTIAAFWILLRYAISGNKRMLWLMVIVPALGFWVKQSLAIWAVFYCAQLAIFDQTRSIKRLVLYVMATSVGLGISIAAGYALWGEHFSYWAFTVLSKHQLSVLRSFQHVLDAWPYFAVGLLGGVVLLRGEKFRLLLGPWLVWLTLLSSEAYTSGLGWMLNHMGPGCLIAGVWFLSAFAVLWNEMSDARAGVFETQKGLRVGARLAIFCLLLSGLGIVQVPVRTFGDDAYRYVREIETEFAGQVPENILLDMGTWIYARSGVVMKDRASPIGERGYSQTGDFSGILQRLKEKRYAKIMVRNLHSPDFWYDHEIWDKSSGIRQALMDNYREIGKIEPVGGRNIKHVSYGFAEISILVPRAK